MTWLRELLLGARMALAGGRAGWLRTGLTALGVGFGVATLLAGVSAPHAVAAQHEREAARMPYYAAPEAPASDTTMLVAWTDTWFRGERISGLRLQPEGGRPPLPPGVTALPGPNELVVSPALARLLTSPEGALLRERLSYPIVGTIADEGLTGPAELYFYLGVDNLDDRADTVRATHFGMPPWRGELDPPAALGVVLAVVVLLLPLGLFVAAAIRFGGEARDRRLAGVRLVGADAQMANRVAAGEALTGSLLGLLAGGIMFLIGRSFVDLLAVGQYSAFPADLSPDPMLTLLLVAGVPTVAVLVTLVAMRRAVIEPLGVTRRSGDVRRRLWWRLLLPVAGVLVLAPLFGDLGTQPDGSPPASVNDTQVGVGLVLILVGVAVLLPWLVQVTIRRLRGGPVAWQLATRRLQADATTATRAVVGIAVAVAGAIGVQTLVTSLQASAATAAVTDRDREADQRVEYYQPMGWEQTRELDAAIRATPGVQTVYTTATMQMNYDGDQSEGSLTIAECPTLSKLAVLESCTDGDVFVVRRAFGAADSGIDPAVGPGDRVRVSWIGDSGREWEWTVPDHARTVLGTYTFPEADGDVLATPAAVAAEPFAGPTGVGRLWSWVWLDPTDRDAAERLRTVIWHQDPEINVWSYSDSNEAAAAAIRRLLLAGAATMVVLIGLSLLIALLDQLRERRRVLAGLAAFGVRRRTLAWSVLWQTVVPVALGFGLAVVAGLTVAWTLLKILNITIVIDWAAIGLVTAVGAAMSMVVTVLGLPLLWRLMRADGLRTE